MCNATRRTVRALTLAVLLAGCGASIAAPDEPARPLIPSIAGTYTYTAPIDQSDDVVWVGTLVLHHEPGADTFTGTHTVFGGLHAPGAIEGGTIDADGGVWFSLSGVMEHTGAVEGGVISGTWVSLLSKPFTGSFTATRTGT